MTTNVKWPNTWKNTKLTYEETDKENSPVSTTDIKYIDKTSLPRNIPDPDGFAGEFYQTYKR